MIKKLAKILLLLLIAAAGLFIVTFAVYFFNLDMKLTSKIEPFLLKHYDQIERNVKKRLGQEAYKEWIQRLRDAAFIKIYPFPEDK